MRPTALVLLLRLSLVVAIAASATLVVDYAGVGESTFCGAETGCSAVREAPFTQWFQTTFGFSLPQLGLGGYLVLLGAALLARTRSHHWLLAGATGGGGAFAAALLVMQATSIKAFCLWCVAVDLAAITAAVAAVLLARARARDDARSSKEPAWLVRLSHPTVSFAWAIAGTASTALPFVWASYGAHDPLPPHVAELGVKGKVTLVAYTDFQCPFCRKLHPVMEELKEKHPDRLHIVRKMAPLDIIHPGATPAALAYLCTAPEQQDKMAHLLYTAPDQDLNARAVVGMAEQLGQDTNAFVECMANPDTLAEIDRTKKLFRSLDTAGLPTTYVGPVVVEGFNEEKLRSAVARQVSGVSLELPVWAMVVLMGGVGVGVVMFTTKKAGEPVEEERRHEGKRERNQPAKAKKKAQAKRKKEAEDNEGEDGDERDGEEEGEDEGDDDAGKRR